jgi:hypothetical protein
MSANGWKPRRTETLECPSGQVVQVRRPGPEFMLRAGRVARTFSKYSSKAQKEQDAQERQSLSAEEYGLQTLAKMSDDELAAVMIFARELVCAMLVSPKLVREPRPEHDEIGPDDIGDDFWFLFNYGMSGYFNLKVPVGEGEVDIADMESFRSLDSVSGHGADSESIQPDAEQSAPN